MKGFPPPPPPPVCMSELDSYRTCALPEAAAALEGPKAARDG